MFIVLIRTALLYGLVVVIMRLMGKRQIGELQPFELVIAIMISDLASLPMQDTRIPLLHGIIPIITMLMLQILLSEIQLKSEKVRKIIDGTPSILIRRGKINIKQLKNQRMSINDLMVGLRLQGYLNIDDVEYAILETDGQISIIPKEPYSPLVKQDLNINSKQSELPICVIMDGKINNRNLDEANKTMSWLKNRMEENNISDEKEVFIAFTNSRGDFIFQLKDNVKTS
ncbi:DUF421 domain-containing protein [Desnuesiella massiliensis]|uniref:DUF421 domain-containing protein n=1 Tax=Desnuesiella massiliensis TaxID=1650662 RepID=UPI0006E36B63|nr:DUF421 domain-containing protein [Desnuesiella massiliensis]